MPCRSLRPCPCGCQARWGRGWVRRREDRVRDLRAGQARGEFGALEAQLLTAQVVKVLAHRYGFLEGFFFFFFGPFRVPDIEHIQDVVEQALISADRFDTARAYIVYRDSAPSCAPTAGRWSTSPPRSTSTSTARTGASTPTPTRATRSAA